MPNPIKTAVVDVETTSLNAQKGAIIQLSIRILHGQKEVDSHFLRILPHARAEISEGAGNEEINAGHLILSSKAAFVSLEAFLNKHIDPYDKTDKLIFVAHNANFDMDYCRMFFWRNNNKFFHSYFHSTPVCTRQLAMLDMVWSTKKTAPTSLKLGDLCKYYKIALNESKQHFADYDTEITVKLYKELRRRVKVVAVSRVSKKSRSNSKKSV